ncbi:MAG: DUF2652 domain-containing protein [Actinomycetota bacterium]
MNGVDRGSLILADISGYTKYLAGVELEHSADILADLINTIVDQMKGQFTLAKLEGDAIFAYAIDHADPEASALVTTVESCYFAFVQRRATIDRATSCTCEACTRIPTLDLKFVVHHGKFAIHEVAGNRELVGPDVITVHRLLKNEIVEKTGIEAYAFFSGDCMEHYGLDAEALTLQPHTETYDDVGEVPGWVLDLGARWTKEQERRVIYLKGDEPGVAEMRFEMPAPPPLVWEHMTSPVKRLAWQQDTLDLIQDNPRGARGVGTVNHCVHGDSSVYEEILDWKPYRYFTNRTTIMPGITLLFTEEFEPVDGGLRTELVIRMKPESDEARQALAQMGEQFAAGFAADMATLQGILAAERRAEATPG